MDAADRRFTWILLVTFGPLFVAGGFMASFTIEGALLVFIGLGMLLSGVGIAVRMPVLLSALAGAALFAALTAQMAMTISE